MTTLATLVAESIAARGDNFEVAVFGSSTPDLVAALLERYCAEHLTPVDEALFYRVSVGAVAAFVLAGGRRVVVKVHRWNADKIRLAAVQRVQRHLRAEGIPAPTPLVAPTALGAGVATAEEHLGGRTARGLDPAVRAALATQLHRIVTVASTIVGVEEVGGSTPAADTDAPLWGEPHDLKFDFAASAAGAEWIDDLARAARTRVASHREPAVIGHLDWRVEQCAFADDGVSIVAIYDWDALALAPEPVVVGQAATQFGIDWRAPVVEFPTVADMRGFVHDYEIARGAPFTFAQRDPLDPASVALTCYGARCQHSLVTLNPEVGAPADGWWIGSLRTRPDGALTLR